MPADLPPEIVVTETADRIHYRLPRPPLGAARFAGCFVIAIGCVPAAMGVAFIAFAATVIPNLSWPVMVAACLLLLMPLAFLFFGLILAYIGAWMLAGRQEITLTARHIRSTYRVGPMRWSVTRSRSGLKQFTVVRGGPLDPNTGAAPLSRNKLQAEGEGSRPVRLAWGYPEDWLQALADDLARKCHILPAEQPSEAVSVASESAAPHDIRDRPERPLNCRALLEERADGVALKMPPAGIWRGSNKFVVLWTFLWCGIVLFATIMLVMAIPQGNLHDKRGQPLSPLCLLSVTVPLWLIGIVFILVILHQAYRSVMLTVAGERLLVVQSGLFGMRQWEWPRDAIAELRVACDRRAKIGEGKKNPYYPWQIDLRIVPCDEPAVNVITYREGDPRKADLEWMATVLRASLRLSEAGR
jgi:hypothetical protein